MKIHIRNIETNKIEYSIQVSSLDENYIDRLVLGILEGLSSDFYIDESEIDKELNNV